jgi:hypothetical protein
MEVVPGRSQRAVDVMPSSYSQHSIVIVHTKIIYLMKVSSALV